MGTQPKRPLSQAIAAAGLRREEVAEELGVSVALLNAVTMQYVALPEKHVARLAELTGLTPDEVRAMGHRPRRLVAHRLVRERGYTYTELQALLGLSYYQVTTSLNGQRKMPRRAAERLSELLGVPVELATAPEPLDEGERT